MKLTWESYKKARVESCLLKSWLEKCSFSDDEETPEVLKDLIVRNPEVSVIKLETEYWAKEKERRDEAKERKLANLAFLRQTFPGAETKVDTHHLLHAIGKNYKYTTYWEGQNYCRLEFD